MNPNNIPNWLLFLGFLLVVLVGGWLGELDYQDQRAAECRGQGKGYSIEADICINLVKGEK